MPEHDEAGCHSLSRSVPPAALIDLSVDLTEVDGPSPSGWSDSVKCYRIGLPTGEAESAPESGASNSEQHFLCSVIHSKLSTSKLMQFPAVQFDLLFAHTPSYPDEAPLIKLSK